MLASTRAKLTGWNPAFIKPVTKASETGRRRHLMRVEHGAVRRAGPDRETIGKPVHEQRDGVWTPPVRQAARVELPPVVTVGEYRGTGGVGVPGGAGRRGLDGVAGRAHGMLAVKRLAHGDTDVGAQNEHVPPEFGSTVGQRAGLGSR